MQGTEKQKGEKEIKKNKQGRKNKFLRFPLFFFGGGGESQSHPPWQCFPIVFRRLRFLISPCSILVFIFIFILVYLHALYFFFTSFNTLLHLNFFIHSFFSVCVGCISFKDAHNHKNKSRDHRSPSLQKKFHTHLRRELPPFSYICDFQVNIHSVIYISSVSYFCLGEKTLSIFLCALFFFLHLIT